MHTGNKKGTLGGPDIFRWGGVFHVKGWAPNSSVFPSRPLENKLFGGISRDFEWGSARKVEKKCLCSSFGPYTHTHT